MKNFKKLTIFILATIMLFSVVGFTACDNSSDTYWQARIAEIERQNQELRDLLYRLINAPSDSPSNEDLLALITILQQQIMDLQEDLKNSNADNAELLERIKELEQQNQDLQYKITNNLQARLKELKEQNEILLDQIYQLQKVINDTNTSLLALIETLQKQVTESQKQIEQLEWKIKALRYGVDLPQVIFEKIADSWWDDRATVDVSFPRIIKRDQPLVITVITTNITDVVITRNHHHAGRGSGLGVAISTIRLQSTIFRIGNWATEVIEPTVGFIQPRESVLDKWYFETDIVFTDVSVGFPIGEYQPYGTYDIYLENGMVFRNAFIVI